MKEIVLEATVVHRYNWPKAKVGENGTYEHSYKKGQDHPAPRKRKKEEAMEPEPKPVSDKYKYQTP